MDYIEKLQDALKFTWKYKGLWLLGLLISLFSSSGSSISIPSLPSDSTQSRANDPFMANVIEALTDPMVIVIASVILLIILVLAVLAWYLYSIARAGLTNAVITDAKAKKVTLSLAWQYGRKKAFKLMILDLVKIPFALLTGLPLILAIILGVVISAGISGGAREMAPLVILVICLVGGFLSVYGLIYVVVWAAIGVGADRYLIIKNSTAMEALSAGWMLVRSELLGYLLGFVVFLIPGCIWGIVSFVVGLIFLVPMTLVLFAALAAGPVIFIALLAVMLLLYIIFASLVLAPYKTLEYTYWTMIVSEFIEKKL